MSAVARAACSGVTPSIPVKSIGAAGSYGRGQPEAAAAACAAVNECECVVLVTACVVVVVDREVFGAMVVVVVATDVVVCTNKLVVTSSARTIVVGDTMTPSAEIDKLESASGTNPPCSCTVPATDSNARNVKTPHNAAALNEDLRFYVHRCFDLQRTPLR